MSVEFSNKPIVEILRDLERSPLPSSVRAIEESRKMLQDLSSPDDSNNEEIVKALSQYNPEFFAFLFKSAKMDSRDVNADSLGDSLHVALLKLGFEEVMRLVVLFLAHSENVSKTMPKNVQSFASRVWVTAYKIGKQSAIALKAHKRGLSDEVYLLSMMQNIGIAALIHSNPHNYLKVVQSEAQLPLDEKERLVFGVDHYQLGKAITEKWNLPRQIRSSIQFEETGGEVDSAKENEDEALMFKALYLHKHIIESERVLSRNRRALDPHFRYSEAVLVDAKKLFNVDQTGG